MTCATASEVEKLEQELSELKKREKKLENKIALLKARDELAEMKAFHGEVWNNYGSEIALGSFSKPEGELAKRISELEKITSEE